MKISVIYLIVIFILSQSCSSFLLSRNLKKESQKICLTSEGRGRLHVKDSKYVFSFESLFNNDEAQWDLLLDFPLRSPERFTLDWSGEVVKFKTTLETKILRENKGINPRELDNFVKGIGSLLSDVAALQGSLKADLENKWLIDSKKIESFSQANSFKAEFSNLVGDSHFGLMTVSYFDKLTLLYKMELVVRKCIK